LNNKDRRQHATSGKALVPAMLAASILALAAGAAQAETLRFHAVMSGASELPANTTTGTGESKASLDTVTKVFTYSVSFNDLTGPATAVHFHGPALPAASAPPVVTLTHDSPWPADLIKGTATLTNAQIADLKAGKWYVNVHTVAHPEGEIRGQVTLAP
jgi:hypothetical protein